MASPKSRPEEVMVKVVELLRPLPSEDRQRVIDAAQIMLGENIGAALAGTDKAGTSGGVVNNTGDLGGGAGLSRPHQVQVWMKQNEITDAMIEQVYHFADGGFEVIAASVPGDGKKFKTINAYIVAALGSFIADGIGKIEDQTARDLCTTLGCFDTSNHAANTKAIGNELTGSKTNGWTLTAPGKTRGASLLKEMAS